MIHDGGSAENRQCAWTAVAASHSPISNCILDLESTLPGLTCGGLGLLRGGQEALWCEYLGHLGLP